MADEVTATDKGQNFTPHDAGQFAAACADVIDLGQRVEQWPGQTARIMDKCAIVFVTDTEGETKEIAGEFSVSMNELAKLRKFLEAWRGKSYSDDQAKAGVPLHKLVGHGALISVEHKTSAKGRTYGTIATIAPLPKVMSAPSTEAYERLDFWAERKKTYAEEAVKWAAAQAKVAKSLDEMPDMDEGEEDSIPF